MEDALKFMNLYSKTCKNDKTSPIPIVAGWLFIRQFYCSAFKISNLDNFSVILDKFSSESPS